MKKQHMEQTHFMVPTYEEFQKKHATPKKQSITVQISIDVLERIKNAVYWTPGLTLASLAEKSLEDAVNLLERKREKPFPHRRDELKSGRPLK